MKKIFFYFCVIFTFTIFILPQEVFAAPQINPTDIPGLARINRPGPPMSFAGSLLDWSIQNYSWKCISKGPGCENLNKAVQKLWLNIITYLVIPLIMLGILVTAVVLITTHGQNLTIKQFIVNFIISLIIISLSYSSIQFVYQAADMIEGFFLRLSPNNPCPPACISQTEILPVKLDFITIIRLIIGVISRDPSVTESMILYAVFTIMAHSTFITISIILMIRKIILWLILIISPIFALFFLFKGGRPIIKTYIKYFITWLLYAPLLALFLNITVYLFNQIPLELSNPATRLSQTEIFAQFLFAIIILHIDYLIPFLLFRFALSKTSVLSDDGALMKMLSNMNTNIKSIYRNLPEPAPSSHNAFSIQNTPFIKKPLPTVKNTDPEPTNKPI